MYKPEVITFKVDGALKEAFQGIQNRSEFIRSAILAAVKLGKNYEKDIRLRA